jgi:hypothetical protein
MPEFFLWSSAFYYQQHPRTPSQFDIADLGRDRLTDLRPARTITLISARSRFSLQCGPSTALISRPSCRASNISTGPLHLFHTVDRISKGKHWFD